MFPYYIVRFKREKIILNTKKIIKFPYYIVRFKPQKEAAARSKPPQFPYYIVRFKQPNAKNPLIPLACFHTT